MTYIMTVEEKQEATTAQCREAVISELVVDDIRPLEGASGGGIAEA